MDDKIIIVLLISLMLIFLSVFIEKSNKHFKGILYYSLFVCLILLSLFILTFDVVAFNMKDDYYLMLNLLIPVAYIQVIYISVYKLLTDFHHKKVIELFTRFITSVLVVSYVLIINLLKYIITT